MLTVKQLSDKLEVSKQTINNNVPDDMSYKKIKGINYIDSELEIVITNNINRNKNRFSYDSRQSPELGNADTSSNDELIKQLRSEIDTLSNQLTVKDNQLEQLTKALTNQQSLQLESYRHNQLDNTTHDKSNNVESDTHNMDSTSNESEKDIDSNDIYYKDTEDNSTHHKKSSLLSRIFNK